MKSIVNMNRLARAAMTLLLAVLTTAVAWADGVAYIDASGNPQNCATYTTISESNKPTTLGVADTETWYVVQGTVNYTTNISLTGDTHIILADGAALNIGTNDSPVTDNGLFGWQYNLSVYAQDGQNGDKGALNIYSSAYSFVVNNLTLAGGTVNATGDHCEVIRDMTFNNVTANFTATLTDAYGIVCTNFTVDNSQLEVSAIGPSIQASGVITLGCTAATDFIKVTSTGDGNLPYGNSGTVKIAEGQTLYEGINAYTGTLSDAQRQAIGGKKLTNVAPPTYSYIGLDGTEVEEQMALVINANNMPTQLSGWYVVQGTVDYTTSNTTSITLTGDTHIILADNAVMNVSGIYSVSGNNYSLTIYGQSGQSGKLNVTSQNSYAINIIGGDITIAGGEVTATGSYTGIQADKSNNNGGKVTIKNAKLTATGTGTYGYGISSQGNIIIDNSNVTATSTNLNAISSQGNITIDNSNVITTSTYDKGIYANGGDITISGGEVETTGRNSGIQADKYNNNGGEVTILNAKVTATGTGNSGVGFKSINGDITIDNSNVTATAISGNGAAIFANYGNIIIRNGGKTIAYGGNVGIYAYKGDVTISGGEAEATGNTCGIFVQKDSNDGKGVTILNAKVTATGTGNSGVGINSINGDITIDNSNVTATSESSDNGAAIFAECGNIFIKSGGKTIAYGGNVGIYAYKGDVTITGGQVSATGKTEGIDAESHQETGGNIILGWTNTTDYIYASSYYASGSISVADGKTFTDGGTATYGNGSLTSEQLTAIAGKTLFPYPTFALAGTKIGSNYWTTFYSGQTGFAIKGDENACAYTAEAGTDNVTLHQLGKVIPVGTAVIIVGEDSEISMTTSTADAEETVEGNHLHGVDEETPKNTSSYSAKTLYFLSNKNSHFGFHEFAGTTIPAHKAFLALPESQDARSLTMTFEDTTSLLSPEWEDEGASPRGGMVGVWYSLDGRQLGGKPTAKGVYINNNRKVVVK